MSSVSNPLIPDSACVNSLNFRYDKVGAAVQRDGYSKIGATVSSNNYPEGIGYWINGAASSNRIVTAYHGTNYAYDGATWTSIGTGLTNGVRVRFAQYLNYLFRVGGGAATKTWDGDTAHSFGDTDVAKAASGTITISNDSLFPLLAGVQLTIGDLILTEGVDWFQGASATLTASNLNTAINSGGSSLVSSTVNSNVVTVTALATGYAGNAIKLVPTSTMTINDYTGMVGCTVTVRGRTLTEGIDFVLGPDNATSARYLALAIMQLGDTAYTVTTNSNVITLTGVNMSGNELDASTSVATSDFVVLASAQEGGLTLSLNPNPAVDSTTGEVDSANTLYGGFQAPSASLILNFKNVIYLAGNASLPDRLYFSNVPDVDGALTWAEANYIDINPSDGDTLTALEKTGTTMILFKRGFTYRFNGTSTDAEPLASVGAISQEVVQNVQGQVLFFHPSGVFATDGGIPVEISRPIKDWIDAIPDANYENMCSYRDGNRYGLYLGGDVTKDGRTYANLCLEYDTQTQAWQFQQFHHDFRAFTNVTNSSVADYVAGAAFEFVTHMDSSSTLDIDQPINFERQTRAMYFDGEYTLKELNDFAFYLSGAPGALFQASGDGGKWVTLGAAVTGQDVVTSAKVQGRAISFKISGENRSAPCTWTGFDICRGRSLGLRKN